MTLKLLDLITENYKNDYGCVMLFFKFPGFEKVHDAIDPNDLYEDPDDDSFGFESEPHITLLYGLHKEVSDDDVKSILKNIVFDDCKINEIGIFENEKYDVLKFDVGYATRGGAFLHKANREFKKFPHTNEFSDYHPHMTIAYLKSGKGQKWANKLKNVKEHILTPKEAIYSKPDGSKLKINITLKK